jgi:hypothetical protein
MKRARKVGPGSSTAEGRRPGRPRKHPVEEPPERVAAYLSRDLATALRVFAVTQRPRRSVSDVIGDAVQQYLDRKKI